DGDINAVELHLLVAALVDGALVDDGVDGDRGLSGLPVADDQLALAAADGNEAVDRLDSRLHGFIHGAAWNDPRRFHVHAAALRDIGDVALAVDRIAERVDDPSEQSLADRHVHDGAGALDRVAFLDAGVAPEDHRTDIVGFEIERHALDAAGKFDQFAGLDVVEPINPRDAVADAQDFAHFADLGFGAEVLDLALEDR